MIFLCGTTNNFEKFAINPSSNYTLIDLWHSSCGNCIKELIDYKEIYSIYSEKGFEIISITGDRPDMLNYLSKLREKYEFPWPEYLDENRKIVESEFSVAIFPTNFLLDNEGRIIRKNLSPTELESFLHENL
jgi:peroxiredoxin